GKYMDDAKGFREKIGLAIIDLIPMTTDKAGGAPGAVGCRILVACKWDEHRIERPGSMKVLDLAPKSFADPRDLSFNLRALSILRIWVNVVS
ncbi:MAG TPA: hypothetical protein PK970_07725, partial [Hyphomicrobiaceae bacterium]|nr:hypothetical protein [Hyphomicrobiaceae bacterium]